MWLRKVTCAFDCHRLILNSERNFKSITTTYTAKKLYRIWEYHGSITTFMSEKKL